MSKSTSFTDEEAAVLYTYVTGSSFAPSKEAVEGGAVPSSAQDAVNKLAEAAARWASQQATEPVSETKRTGPPAGTRSSAGPVK